MTRNGIQPVNKKVETIVKMTPPKTQKKVRMFIGLVNYYRDMWSKRSPLLQTLTALTSKKVTFKCTFVEQKSFDEMKQIVACNKFLIHPDFNKHLGIIYSLGLATEVPELTHYWVVWFHPRASAKVTSRLCPFIISC